MQLEVITREPAAVAHSTPVLFVHGMWDSAWCWLEHFLPYFAQHGYKSHALSLRGHGASEGRKQLRWTPLASFVADVAQVVGQLESPPVLVGHSMGGMVVQKYLESHQAPAAVLLASPPPRGMRAATMRFARRHPMIFLKINLTFNLFHKVSTLELFKEAFFSADIPESELAMHHARLQDESYRALVDMNFLDLPRPDKVNTPMLVLGTTDDTQIASNEIEATAKAYHTRAELFPDMGHAMMLDIGWQAVADRILEWLDQQGL